MFLRVSKYLPTVIHISSSAMHIACKQFKTNSRKCYSTVASEGEFYIGGLVLLKFIEPVTTGSECLQYKTAYVKLTFARYVCILRTSSTCWCCSLADFPVTRALPPRYTGLLPSLCSMTSPSLLTRIVACIVSMGTYFMPHVPYYTVGPDIFEVEDFAVVCLQYTTNIICVFNFRGGSERVSNAVLNSSIVTV